MDSTSPEISSQAGLEIVTSMINHRGEAGPEFHKKLEDFAKRLFQQIKAGPRGTVVRHDGMPLDLPHHGHRHMRALRQLALRPAQLAVTIADNPRDRSPVLRIAFRHAFLRAPLPALRVADPSAIPRQTETNRDQTTSIRNNSQAEISATSVISVPVVAVRSFGIPADSTRGE